MIVMLVSIVLFSVVKFDSLIYNFLVRIALIPIVAGVSYEIIRVSAKKRVAGSSKQSRGRRLAAKHNNARARRSAARSCY